MSYRPIFSPFIYGPNANHVAMGRKLMGKKRESITYSTDRENEFSKIFIRHLRLIRHGERKLVEVKFKVNREFKK